MSTASIRILREVFISSVPEPGSTERLLAITYQVGPRPPQVIIVKESELPDRLFLIENPDQREVPAELQAQGDQVRRQLILTRLGETPPEQGRVI